MKLRTPARLASALFALAAALPAQAPDDVLDAMIESITADECMAHVEILASPEYGGRATPSRGLEKAAVYVETQLEALGLAPAGKDGSYRLPYTIHSLVPDEGSQLTWTDAEGALHETELMKSFLPVTGSREVGAAGEPVLVGYAIDAKKLKWQDLNPSKVRGKVVFALSREPRADDPKEKRFEGTLETVHGSLLSKAKAVEEAGGAALVIIPDAAGYGDVDGPMPDLLPFPLEPYLNLERLRRLGGWPEIPVASVSRAVAERIFDLDLAEYQQRIDKRRKPDLVKAAKGVSVDVSVRWKSEDVEYWNLGAKIEGSDETDEVVVLGAHLDHVDQNYMMSMRGLPGGLHPGADDNASGSAALLEVAQALAGHQPRKDILLLWFSAEEIGLLGSRAYCEEPLVPHEQTIAMFNMDMVGRGDPKKMNIGGLWDEPGWERLVKEQAKRIKSRLKLDLDQGRDLYARSDQYAFHQKGVLGLFFFEADLSANKDYHQQTDTADKIDGRKMAGIAQLLTATCFAVAYEGSRP